MKLTTPLLVLTFTILFSCNGDEEVAPTFTPLGQKIIGDWIVAASIDNSNESTSTYPATIDDFTISFKSDSRVQLNGPCNAGQAQNFVYTESGTLVLSDIVTTLKFCSSIENDWESRIVGGLNTSYHATISGNNMEILTDGNYSLKLERQ
ncbi:MAG: META domain-containing protein [Bacteroidia bacterium]|nr:META domain-containing protein [Bacteroidia bacterium]NNJ56443.1 META domain-containing protein [Bacteroidia bacterium]